MYSIGKNYKIHTKENNYFTALILEEDNFQLKIHTEKDGELIISKELIKRSKIIEQKSIGDKDDQRQ